MPSSPHPSLISIDTNIIRVDPTPVQCLDLNISIRTTGARTFFCSLLWKYRTKQITGYGFVDLDLMTKRVTFVGVVMFNIIAYWTFNYRLVNVTLNFTQEIQKKSRIPTYICTIPSKGLYVHRASATLRALTKDTRISVIIRDRYTLNGFIRPTP